MTPTEQELYDNRDKFNLVWGEPWGALAPDGTEVQAHLTMMASVQDCINLRRSVPLPAGRTQLTDIELMADFIVVNWATPVPIKDEALIKRAERYYSKLGVSKSKPTARFLSFLLEAYKQTR